MRIPFSPSHHHKILASAALTIARGEDETGCASKGTNSNRRSPIPSVMRDLLINASFSVGDQKTITAALNAGEVRVRQRQ